MARKITKAKPRQGARLAQLRNDAGFTQVALAQRLGLSQQTIAYWEQSSRPPPSDALPKLARVLGVTVEDLLDASPARAAARRPGPVGKLQRVFEQANALPRSKQELVIQFVATLVEQQRKAG